MAEFVKFVSTSNGLTPLNQSLMQKFVAHTFVVDKQLLVIPPHLCFLFSPEFGTTLAQSLSLSSTGFITENICWCKFCLGQLQEISHGQYQKPFLRLSDAGFPHHVLQVFFCRGQLRHSGLPAQTDGFHDTCRSRHLADGSTKTPVAAWRCFFLISLRRFRRRTLRKLGTQYLRKVLSITPGSHCPCQNDERVR